MLDEDIKKAFQRVKEDMFFLGSEINSFKVDLLDIKEALAVLSENINKHSLAIFQLETPAPPNTQTDKQTNTPTDTPALQHIPTPHPNTKKELEMLFSSIKSQHQALQQVNQQMYSLKQTLETLKNTISNTPTHSPTQTPQTPTISSQTPTHPNTPTHDLPLYGLKTPNTEVSSGNGGVPTDRQTDRQTDQHTQNSSSKFALTNEIKPLGYPLSPTLSHPGHSNLVFQSTLSTSQADLSRTSELLENLDAIKKELRLKIKRLTPQEMTIFSLIYNLDEHDNIVDYSILANKTNLSESSIRDYVLKIGRKGIPLLKEKLNNKRILLHVSPDLKKLASLETLLRLREI